MVRSRTRRFTTLACALSLTLLVVAVGATQLVQAETGTAVAAKKCKKTKTKRQKRKRHRCGSSRAPATSEPGTSPVITTPDSPAITTPDSPHKLTVAVPGNGSVTSSPAGIDCPGDCSETYAPGQVVTLTSTPDLHYVLDQWTGDCGGNGQCQVTMGADRSVVADFGLEMDTLTVLVTSDLVPSSDGGRVTSDSGGIDCRESGGACSARYPYGTPVTLTETPDPSPWIFNGWGGNGCSGSLTTCTVTLTGPSIVYADFADT
jgi:hypothetical protein